MTEQNRGEPSGVLKNDVAATVISPDRRLQDDPGKQDDPAKSPCFNFHSRPRNQEIGCSLILVTNLTRDNRFIAPVCLARGTRGLDGLAVDDVLAVGGERCFKNHRFTVRPADFNPAQFILLPQPEMRHRRVVRMKPAAGFDLPHLMPLALRPVMNGDAAIEEHVKGGFHRLVKLRYYNNLGGKLGDFLHFRGTLHKVKPSPENSSNLL